MSPMHKVFAAVLLMQLAALGGEPGAYVEQPNLVGRITAALVASKADHLTPHISRQDSREFSYHLKSVAYLGSIERGAEKFILATALFIRSSAKGSEYPPARGHGYLLCLSPDFHLISHCQLDFLDVDLVGALLVRQKETVADFSRTDDAARRDGFLVDGTDFLSYPFMDKLPVADSSGAKKP